MTKGNGGFAHRRQHIGIAYADVRRAGGGGVRLLHRVGPRHARVLRCRCSRSRSRRCSRDAAAAATRRAISWLAPTRSARKHCVRRARSPRRRRPRSRGALAAYLGQLVPLVQSEAGQIRALKRPPGAARDRLMLSQYLAALGQVVGGISPARGGGASSGDAQAIASVEATLRASPAAALAARYGLRSCGTPGADGRLTRARVTAPCTVCGQMPEDLSLGEAAAALGVSVDTLRRWDREGPDQDHPRRPQPPARARRRRCSV